MQQHCDFNPPQPISGSLHMSPPLFPYLAEHGRVAVAQIAALSAFDGERAENLRVLRQVVERQRGCLTAEQCTAYFPSEVLDYAASRPDQAAAYTVALLILLQSAIVHRRRSTELGLCHDRYRRENIGCRLPEAMRQALDEAFAAAEKHGVLA